MLPIALDSAMRSLFGDRWQGDDTVLAAFSGDGSRRVAMPLAVVFPETADEVAALVRACRQCGVPLVARGSGTSSTGAALAGGCVAVSFARMNRILALHAADRCVVVEPGVLNADLQRRLKPHGLFWPPDPASADVCTVGGNLACNAGGPRTVKYGATRDNVLGLTAVTGTGDIIRVGSATTKDASGYDLTHLIVGSEGTLGLIVDATLRLLPIPQAQGSLRAMFVDADAAADAAARIMAQPQTPAMLEFMDATSIGLARDVGGAQIGEGGAMLMIEADGDAQTLPHVLGALADAVQGPGLLSLERADDPVASQRLWAARKALSHAQKAIAPAKLNEDVVVPVSKIPTLVAGIQALSREFDIPIIAFGHAGNGNLHANILYDPDDPRQNVAAHAALPRLFEQVLALGGTLSGEHGIGIAKRGFMSEAFDPPTLAAMHAVKNALDPDGILNPGKVLPDL